MKKETFRFFMISFLIFLSIQFVVSQELNSRARGYSQIADFKTSLLNNGIIGGDVSPAGFYHGLQYLPNCSFILGIPGKDGQGNAYPWATGEKWLYDRWAGEYKWYGSDSSYWGPTVSESWMDRTINLNISDWEAVENSELNLFGDWTAGQLASQWTSGADDFPVLAHSNQPQTFPGSGWPGFWGWDENGQEAPGTFFSDEDIYFEMDDRFPNRDVYPEGVLPGYPTQVKVKVMASAFKDFPQDFIIFRYRLINESPFDYKDMYGGFYFDADIYNRMGNGSYAGRTNDDDMMRLNLAEQTAYIWDLDGASGWETELANIGISLIETPPAAREVDLDGDGSSDILPGEACGLTGWHYFDWYFRPGARDVHPNGGPWTGDGVTPGSADREEIQYKLMAGDTSNLSPYNKQHYFHPPLYEQGYGELNPYYDSTVGILRNFSNGLDAVYIMSCGPFNLDSGDSTEIVMALLAAPDSLSLLQTAKMSRLLYKSKYHWHGLNILAGNGGEKFSGNTTVSWEADNQYPYPVNKADLYLGKGYESIWEPLALNIDNYNSYTFNSAKWEDGVFYKLYVLSSQDHFVYGSSDDFFTIDNPGNGTPDLVVLNPQDEDTLTGISFIKWLAGDAENDALSLSIKITIDGVDNLILPFSDTETKDSLKIDWNNFREGEATLTVKLKDEHGALREVSVKKIFVAPQKTQAMQTIFKHKSGKGKGLIETFMFDSSAVKMNTYQLYFSAGDTAEYATVAVIDTVAGQIEKKVISENIPYINTSGSAIFDGISLTISGYLPPKIDSTYWKSGQATSKFNVSSQSEGNPADYEIVFGEVGVDTSINNIPVPFKVYNKTFLPETALDFYFFGNPPDKNEIDDGDVIYLRETNLGGKTIANPISTYRLTYSADSLDIGYQVGDVYRFTTLRFFSERDTLEFTPYSVFTSLPAVKQIVPQNPELEQNYPNPFNPVTNITYKVVKQAHVELEVYNMLGQKVETLVNKKQKAGEYNVVFNGQSLASGIYFYRFRTGRFVKVRKMVLIR